MKGSLHPQRIQQHPMRMMQYKPWNPKPSNPVSQRYRYHFQPDDLPRGDELPTNHQEAQFDMTRAYTFPVTDDEILSRSTLNKAIQPVIDKLLLS